MGLFVYVRLLFCFITAYAPEKVDVGVFWISFLEKFFRFDEKNSCAYPSCMLYWWCIYHPGMTLTTRSRGVRETHRTERNGTAMKKRLLSILLVFVMVLSTLPIPAFAEDGGEAAPVCICETACTAEAMNEDCPVCGAEGAHLHDCAKYVKPADDAVTQSEDVKEEPHACTCETACTVEAMNADCLVCNTEDAHLHDCAKYVEGAENPAETTTPTAEPVNVGETEATTAPVVPETEKDETLPEDAPDTLALDAENLISVQSGETMSDELYDSLSYATFTLSASEYQCGEAGHTGSITDICLNSVDLSDWDANRKIKVNFDISFQCDTPGCPRGKEMNRYNKTRTFTDSDSCHTPVSATANYRKACSSNNNDLIVLTLTSNKSIAYKEYFPKKETTCTEAGYESYWMCGSDVDSNKCRKIFSDEDCTKELAAPIAIPAKGHYFPASAYHAELPGTCTDIGHVEYWHCGQCYKYFTDNTGTTGISNIMLPKDKDNHAQAPQYIADDVHHTAKYNCCNTTLPMEAHSFDYGVCDVCGYVATFLVQSGRETAYFGSYNDAMAALAREGATFLMVLRDYDGTIDINVDGKRTVLIGDARTNVRVSGININGGSVTISNYGTVGSLANNAVTILGKGGGRYDAIRNNMGDVGALLGSCIVYKTEDGVFLRSKDEACKADSIQNVRVIGAPISYIEITGAGKGTGEEYDVRYAHTVKAGETVTFRSDVYQISGATAAGAVITSWDCGTIPAENVDVQTSNGSWRSTLTLTNITPGVYPLVCTVNSDNNGEIYSVRATVTLAVEAGETEYTLTFDANGGTGAPAAMTGETNTFVIPDTIPTRENAHFGGWALTAGADSPQYQPGDTVTIDGGMKMTLYAYWRAHGDGNGDGFCDGGEECLHGKDADGYCTVSGCTHNADGHDCCPKRGPSETVITTLPTLPAETYVGTQFLDEALEGGVAQVKGTDTVVPGKFAFEGEYGGSVSFVGENRLHVIFTPDDTEAYTTAECEVIVTGIRYTITEVLTKFAITDKPLGTPLAELGIPTEGVTVKTDSGAMFAPIPVIWDTSAYDPNSLEPQTIYGTLDVANSYFHDKIVTETDVKATIEVSLMDTRVFQTTIVTPPTVEGTFYALDRYETLTSGLKGGKAMANGQEIEGTFEFDEDELLYGDTAYPGIGLKYGQLTRTVVFKPTNSRNYTTAACTVTVNVLPLTIVRINPNFEDITDKPIGTAFEQLGLAEAGSMDVMRGDPQKTTIMSDTVVWDKNQYDPNTPYEQRITGRLVLSTWKDYIAPPEGASTVSVKVKLKYDPVVPVIVTAPTFRWTKGDFRLGDNQIFVSETFQIGTETPPEEADEIGALIGGEARVGGKKIDGTFSFKAGTPKWFSAAGTYNVTVVFTPSDTVRYAPAECTIPIEVVKRTLLSIEPSTDITNKEVGTEFDALWLPPFVNCRTEDGSFYSGIGVTWDKTSYDLNSTAEQAITGTLNLGDIPTIQQPVPELKATVKVRLIPHDWSDWTPDGNGTHSRVCARNSSHKETVSCSGGTATCQAKAVCSVCGQAYGQFAAHDFTAEVVEEKYLKSAATCTEKAVYYKSCTVCGEKGTETFEVGNILGHDWGEWQPNGNGIHSRICKRNATHKETVSCSGGTATCQAKAVCSVCGQEYGQLAAHGFTAEVAEEKYLKSAATCTEKATYYKSCTVCGEKGTETFEVGNILGHDWGEWQSNGNDTHSRICTRNSGHKETVNCSGGTATCQAKAVCAVCRHEYGQLGTHSFTAETVEEQYLKSAATCTEKAVYYRSCATCGLSAKDTAEEAVFETRALGHDWGKWQSNGDGTHTHVCTRDDTHKETVSCSGGTATCVEQATCKDCGGKYGEKDAANHTGAKKWTTTKTTHEQKWSCCGEITVAKEAHTFGKWVVTEKATSRKDGEKTRTCEVCDYVETAKIPATGTSPKTGDDSHIGMWAGILCVSLAGIVALVVWYKRKNRK